jgi:hypothetical protein
MLDNVENSCISIAILDNVENSCISMPVLDNVAQFLHVGIYTTDLC